MISNVFAVEMRAAWKCFTTCSSRNRNYSAKTKPSLSYFRKAGSEPLKSLNVGQLLKQIATKHPNRESLISCSENSRITFAETLDQADRLASGLLNLGLSKGDCVAIWAPNYEFWYVAMMAIARAGLICVALNPAYQLPEMDFCLKKVDVKAIIAPESFRKQKHYEILAALVPSLMHSKNGAIEDNDKNSLRNVIIYSDHKLPGTIRYKDLLKASSESDASEIEKLQASISPDSCCNIQFSSGTTGLPKAAMLSHFGMVNNAYQVGKRQELDKHYRRICTNNPFFHVGGTVIAITNALNHGTTLVTPSQHFDPEATLNAIVDERCDAIFGMPTMYVDLVSRQRKLKLKLPEINYAIIGGAIATPQLMQDARSVLNIKRFRSIYGLTEGTSTTFHSLPAEDEHIVEEFVGCLGDDIEAKVVDKAGNLVPFGQPGELCQRGYSVMLGYWNDEAKTRETVDADGWLKTGDQFILNENGYGKVVGRLKEMIIRGGENLFPREIEDFLNTHSMILEVHVIGIPDARMGEEVGAFIRLKDSSKQLTCDDIRAFCKGKLSHFKIPRYNVVVKEFPRTASGKIQKFRFLEVFEGEIKNAQ